MAQAVIVAAISTRLAGGSGRQEAARVSAPARGAYQGLSIDVYVLLCSFGRGLELWPESARIDS